MPISISFGTFHKIKKHLQKKSSPIQKTWLQNDTQLQTNVKNIN